MDKYAVMIRDINNKIVDIYIYFLVKDGNLYRFVNLTKRRIEPMIFKTPCEALNWLDATEFEWEVIDY